MKVQYKLVDTDTGAFLYVGEPFEIVEFFKNSFSESEKMSWDEAFIVFVVPRSEGNPKGFME